MITAMILAVAMQCYEAKQAIHPPRLSIPRPIHEPVNISKTPHETPLTTKR
jgi:hypothetical protein